MCTDTGMQRHRMAHKATDTAIPVGKGVNIIQAVMGGRNCQNTRRLAERFYAVTLFEITHEILNPVTGRRNMPPDGNILSGI